MKRLSTILLNVGYLVFIPVLAFTTTTSPLVRAVQILAWVCVALSFSGWCRREYRVWKLRRDVVRRTAKLKATLRAFIEGLLEVFGPETARVFLADVQANHMDPMEEHFSRLVQAECLRLGRTVVAHFDEGGHLVMEVIDDPEIPEPEPDTTDDLSNTWEPS